MCHILKGPGELFNGHLLISDCIERRAHDALGSGADETEVLVSLEHDHLSFSDRHRVVVVGDMDRGGFHEKLVRVMVVMVVMDGTVGRLAAVQ